MKKSLILAVLAMAANSFAFASDNLDNLKGSASVTSTSPNVYKLVYNSSKANRVRVVIRDQAGRIVMEDAIYSQKGFVRPYNFTGMPAGKYNVVVTDADGNTELAVAYNTAANNTVRKAEVKALETNKYQLRMIGNAAEAVELTIYNSNGQAIHTDLLTQKGSFTRIYDLSKAKTDNYVFEVKANGLIVNRVQL